MRSLLALLCLVGAGCAGGIECPVPEQVLAQEDGLVLDCGRATTARRALETLAARPLSSRDRGVLNRRLSQAFRANPRAADAKLTALEQALAELSEARGLQASELRSQLAWEAVGDPDAWVDTGLAELVGRAIAVWERDDDQRLVLTEVDIEGWIWYGSLCREVQAAGPLRISVSDRVEVYRTVRRRFREGSREEQIALAGLGAFWRHVRDQWTAATYSEQQTWVALAPLPPPMTATSMGYLSVLLESDLHYHVEVLHDALGPLRLDVPVE